MCSQVINSHVITDTCHNRHNYHCSRFLSHQDHLIARDIITRTVTADAAVTIIAKNLAIAVPPSSLPCYHHHAAMPITVSVIRVIVIILSTVFTLVHSVSAACSQDMQSKLRSFCPQIVNQPGGAR